MSRMSDYKKKLSFYLLLMIVFVITIHNHEVRVSAEVTPIPVSTDIEFSTPTIEPTPTPILELTPTPNLEPIPEPTPQPTLPPAPEPTKIPEKFVPNTLKLMAEYDYSGNGVTGISKKKASKEALQNAVKAYGKLYGSGMPYNEYKEAMEYQWEDVTEYEKAISTITIDITKSMNYDAYVNILKKLSRYEGVYLYRIGKSTQGRDLYAIEIDVNSYVDKNVIMLTGQVHAREFAGGTFIIKQFVDLIQKAQTDKKTMELLKNNKYVAVPIINVDGREALITNPLKWTTKNGELWKAYTNGTESNRNFPGLQWGQVQKGNKIKWIIATKPGFANYPGDYAGSNIETQAMMKWIYHYTIVEQAAIYLDLHQQGSVIYAGKSWQTKKQEQRSLNLRTKVLSILNNGNTRRKYSRIFEETSYGLKGEGSSLTDYAVSLAIGAKFSPAFGFMAFTDGSKEYILMEIKDLDLKKIKVKELNKNFSVITLEIGYGKSYLGNSSNTRKLLAAEYINYNFDKLLHALGSGTVQKEGK